MKKYIILVVILVFASCSKERQWELVADSASNTAGTYPQVQIDSDETPYIVYKDNTDHPIVKKFIENTWETLGNIEDMTESSSIGLTIDTDDNVYIAYAQKTTNALIVKKYTDSWENISPAGETADGDVAITADNNNNLYIAYEDSNDSGRGEAKKYDGTAWSNLGTTLEGSSDMWDIEIKVDSNNIPYLLYQSDVRLYIQKYTNGAWHNVGTEDFSAYYSPSAKFTINSYNNPVIAISHLKNTTIHAVTVIKFNGNTWEKIGDNITEGEPSSASIALDSEDIPYLVFQDGENLFKASSMIYKDNKWTFIQRNLSTGQTSDKMSFIITENNDAYLAFSDNGKSDKIVVMSYK